MMHATTAPTGRRKITEPMLSALAALPAGYSPTSPGKALSAFKRASSSLGIPRRLVELVDYLVGRTLASDWQGGRVIAWPSNATLCEAMDIGRTQIKTLIRVGQELGVFTMRDAPNGQRYGQRSGGRLVVAYGFDLTPLAARQDEFEQIATAHAERRREATRLRTQIVSLRNCVLSLADLGQEIEAPGDWPSIAAEVKELAAQPGRLP